jgi:hypothetical protein
VAENEALGLAAGELGRADSDVVGAGDDDETALGLDPELQPPITASKPSEAMIPLRADVRIPARSCLPQPGVK